LKAGGKPLAPSAFSSFFAVASAGDDIFSDVSRETLRRLVGTIRHGISRLAAAYDTLSGRAMHPLKKRTVERLSGKRKPPQTIMVARRNNHIARRTEAEFAFALPPYDSEPWRLWGAGIKREGSGASRARRIRRVSERASSRRRFRGCRAGGPGTSAAIDLRRIDRRPRLASHRRSPASAARAAAMDAAAAESGFLAW
jgi:hypothetical protein